MAVKSGKSKPSRPVRRGKRAVAQGESKQATDELTCDRAMMDAIARGEVDVAKGRTVAWREVRRD